MSNEVPVPDELKGNVWIAKLQDFLDAKISPMYGWGRSYSLFPLSFGLACCVFEFFSTAAARWDFARWGLDLARATPRQADMFVISGTVTKKMVPQIVRLYNQMAEPKYVIAMGACATGGACPSAVSGPRPMPVPARVRTGLSAVSRESRPVRSNSTVIDEVKIG